MSDCIEEELQVKTLVQCTVNICAVISKLVALTGKRNKKWKKMELLLGGVESNYC
jgi:hypothetical protein